MLKDKKTVKKEMKSKALIEMQRKQRMDESDDEKLLNDDLIVAKAEDDEEESSENDDDLDEERELRKIMKEQLEKRKKQKTEKEEKQDDEDEKQLFLNPLLAFKNTGADEKKKKKGDDDSSEWSDDDKYDPKPAKDGKEEKGSKLLGKRKKGFQGDIDEVREFFKNAPIEEVPQEDFSKHDVKDDSDSDGLPSGYSSMDSDELAETRALAKKLLRKKFRTQMIADSYSRYAFEDNEDVIPSWFKEDEARAY